MRKNLSRYVVLTPLTVLPAFGFAVSLLRGEMLSALVWGAVYLALAMRAEGRS